MIELSLDARSDALRPFVTKLGDRFGDGEGISQLCNNAGTRSLWAGDQGLIEIDQRADKLIGDVVLVYPEERRLERLIRAGSDHNTLLVTEQCDQLCVMCSQPPKKTHNDRFGYFSHACLLADDGQTIGISGGEPTLHMEPLLSLLETVLTQRPDLTFHILSNGQHFESEHISRLRNPVFRRVVWGIPVYSCDPASHDQVVGKPGAFERLQLSLAHLLRAGARIELRTVLMTDTALGLAQLGAYIARDLPWIEQWSIMDLENAGFARNRFSELRFDVLKDFRPISAALDVATLFDIPARLFNLPMCFVPAEYRHFAVASISDWKQRFAPQCSDCSAKPDCSGFFEWQPEGLLKKANPL